MLIEPLTREQRDHDLAQHMLVPAVNRLGAAAIRRPPRDIELMTRERAVSDDFSTGATSARLAQMMDPTPSVPPDPISNRPIRAGDGHTDSVGSNRRRGVPTTQGSVPSPNRRTRWRRTSLSTQARRLARPPDQANTDGRPVGANVSVPERRQSASCPREGRFRVGVRGMVGQRMIRKAVPEWPRWPSTGWGGSGGRR
jgi:hypothetical protein